MCFSPQRRAILRHQNFKKRSETDMFCTFSLPNVRFVTAACNFSTSELPGMRCFVHFHFQMCVSPQRRTIFRHPTFEKCSEHVVFCTFSLQNVPFVLPHQMFEKCSETDVFCTFSLQNVPFVTAAYNFLTSELPKVLSEWGVLYMFTSKCVFRHSGVQFFDIWTSKSAPKLTCFVHVHFKMCLSSQRRAIFWHLNFQKCSWNEVFCTFSLPNVCCATAAYNFSTSELPKVSRNEVFCRFSLPNVLLATAACIFLTSDLRKVLRTRHVLDIFTSKCAFRHSGVQFLISPLTTWLRTRRFNRPTFGLARHTDHWKNTAFRDFSNIWRGCIFFLLTFALLHLLPSDLTACLIRFSTLGIVGSFYLNFLRTFGKHTIILLKTPPSGLVSLHENFFTNPEPKNSERLKKNLEFSLKFGKLHPTDRN